MPWWRHTSSNEMTATPIADSSVNLPMPWRKNENNGANDGHAGISIEVLEVRSRRDPLVHRPLLVRHRDVNAQQPGSVFSSGLALILEGLFEGDCGPSAFASAFRGSDRRAVAAAVPGAIAPVTITGTLVT